MNAVAMKTPGSTNVEQLVTFKVEDQLFGIPALRVRDVLLQQPLTRVPLSRPEIAGAINLRGHIVTAIDLRARLGAPPAAPGARKMCVVVERAQEAYCLVVDSVGDVLPIESSEVEPNPASLPSGWAQLTRGLFRMGSELLLILDVDQLLTW